MQSSVVHLLERQVRRQRQIEFVRGREMCRRVLLETRETR